MALLPTLPPPPPQLDFPAVEQLRQVLVEGYRDMTQVMLAALDKKMDEFAQEGLAVKSVPASYQQGVKAPQLSRRDKIVRVMVARLGAHPSAFEPGGSYEHTSDKALYEIAKALLANQRRREAAKL